ncbi:hypothetical protein KSS87_022560, partial [Heliosperma pusillum]
PTSSPDVGPSDQRPISRLFSIPPTKTVFRQQKSNNPLSILPQILSYYISNIQNQLKNRLQQHKSKNRIQQL